MGYAVVNPDNTFSGVVYDDLKRAYIDHHAQYGQKMVKVDRALTFAQDGAVLETPTVQELAAEVTAVPDLADVSAQLTDAQLALVELYEMIAGGV